MLVVKIGPASNLLHFLKHDEQPGTPKSTCDPASFPVVLTRIKRDVTDHADQAEIPRGRPTPSLALPAINRCKDLAARDHNEM